MYTPDLKTLDKMDNFFGNYKDKAHSYKARYVFIIILKMIMLNHKDQTCNLKPKKKKKYRYKIRAYT